MNRPEQKIRWLSHREPHCTGYWIWWAGCSKDHPGRFVCSLCLASHKATPENREAFQNTAEVEMSLVKLMTEAGL